MRGNLLGGQTVIRGLVLGSTQTPVRRLDLDDEDDFCRIESALAWYAALVQQLLTVSDYRNNAEPYVDARKMSEADFVAFWIDDVVIHAQLSSRIVHGNAADSRHAGYLTDADLLITEDRAFYGALERVAHRVANAASPRLINRSDTDVVAALSTAIAL
jgi:hypothetical protein